MLLKRAYVHNIVCIFISMINVFSYLFDRKTMKVFNNSIRISIHLQVFSTYNINIFFFKFVAPTFTERLMIQNVVVCISSRPRGWICAFCGVVGSIFVTKYNKRHCTRDIPQGRQKSLWSRYEPGSCGVISSSAGHRTQYIIINSL